MVKFWYDSCNTTRFGGRLGRKKRRRVRRVGLYVKASLVEGSWTMIRLMPVHERGFPHVSTFQDYCAAVRDGHQYHVTTLTQRIPQHHHPAQQRMQRIRNYFQGVPWWGTIRVYKVRASSHVAVVHSQCASCGPIRADLIWLRTRYGNHSGPLTISM